MGCTTLRENFTTSSHSGMKLQRVCRRPTKPSSRLRINLSHGNLARSLLLVVLILSHDRGLAYYHESPTVGRRRLTNINLNGVMLRSSSTLSTRMAASDYDSATPDDKEGGNNNEDQSEKLSKLERKMMKRVIRLEALVAKQAIEIHRLTETCDQLTETTDAFVRIIQLLRDKGLDSDINLQNPESEESTGTTATKKPISLDDAPSRIIESFDDSVIFGTAPASVINAADAAGAAILAAMLGGKQRMLVDVRDAELSTDPETLVQFIELSILPVAAGLEGLKSTRNRVKIVFPKVSQLLEYRRTMALAAPEVVALSTLGFDPVEKKDKLVVIVAPEPDDKEGLAAMRELLLPTDPDKQPIQQPVVILNYHMIPVSDLPVDFETAYHLRLLTVQFMSSDDANEYFEQFQNEAEEEKAEEVDDDEVPPKIEDAALEAAMKHAHEVGMSQGITRAMVIRAYPR
jgi:hypothetical protein